MKRRLLYVLATFAVVLAMMFLQNKVLVGQQELQADVQPVGDKPETTHEFNVFFKDLSGKPVAATANERQQLLNRLKGGGSLKPVKTTAISEVIGPDPEHIKVTLADDENSQALIQRIESRPYRRPNPSRPLFHVTKGIDLQGGVEFSCQLYDEDGKRVPADDEVVHVLRGRLDVSGLTEPTVTRLSNGDIQVVIPGGTAADAARTRAVLETTGRLEFREVLEDYGKDKVVARPNGGWTFAPGVYHNRTDIVAPKKPEIPGQPPTQFYRLSSPPALTGKDVSEASKTIHEGKNAVSISFTRSGTTRNEAFTKAVFDRGPHHGGTGTGRIAIMFDGWVESDPIIIEPSSGHCVISGSFTEDQIGTLRTALKAGSLSVTPRVLSERVVGATLGIETVQRALHTMLWTCVAILVFLAYYYRRLGLVAAACMTLLAALTYSAMSICGATLTMPGIAGLVLSVAMSIDSNILIYERIREELRSGKDIPTSLDVGYDRAFTVIIDSHLTNMAIGAILYWIGSGPVKGFGLTLMLGVAISLFSNVYVGRLLSDFFCRRMRKITMASLVPELRLPYTGMRKFSYALSIVTGIAGLGYFLFGHLLPGVGGTFERNFDIEFTGGNMVQVTFKQPLSTDEVKDALHEAYKRDPQKMNLLNPGELSAPQAYFASFADNGNASRQWMFRGRDEEGAAIEGQRAQAEQEQAKLVRELDRLHAANATADEIRKVDAERAQVTARVNELQTQVTKRTEVFKNQLADAFGERIAKEGEEIIAAKADGRMLHLRLATLDPVQQSVLQPAQKMLHRDAIEDVRIQPATDATAVDIDVTYKQAPAPDTGNEALDPRLASLLTTDNVGLDRAWTMLATTFERAAVDVLAQQHVIVARPFPSSEHFSGQVAGQMKWRALLALIVASCAMLAYIAARYEFGFGVGAVVAQSHDLLLTLGLVSLFGIRIDMTVVAALLTIIGYSANETIVNFDRIRENIRKRPLDPLGKIIDESVAMTIPRTVLTSGSVILALIALKVFGGESVHAFSATLLIGSILGTYSAVFVASPILLMFSRQKLLVPSTPEDPNDVHKPESDSGYDASANGHEGIAGQAD